MPTLRILGHDWEKIPRFLRVFYNAARLLFLAAMLFLLAGCGGEAEPAVSGIVAAEAGAAETAMRAVASTTPPPLQPPAVYTLTPEPTIMQEMPVFALTDPTAVIAQSVANADATATGAAAAALAATEAAAAAETAVTPTPPPTFTPPALPFTTNDDHFWLRRPVPDGGVVWTDKAYPYGSTRGGTLRPHHGVEFYVPSGTEILAAASGTVVAAGNDVETVYGPHANFYGNLVVIELDTRYEGQPVYNLYAHLSELVVSVGQQVEAQELIAFSGATGVADGPHMHFEVRVGRNDYDSTRNPLLWLYPFPEHGTVAGRVLWPSGEPVQEVPIILRRVDAPSKYHGTTSYAAGTVNSDGKWQENFAFDDVVAGYYEVEVQMGDKKFTENVWVFAYRTSFVEIVLEN